MTLKIFIEFSLNEIISIKPSYDSTYLFLIVFKKIDNTFKVTIIY